MNRPVAKRTLKEYLNDPSRCPVCNSLDIEQIESPIVKETEIQLRMVCDNSECQAFWIDVCTLTAIADLYVPINNGNDITDVDMSEE